MTTVVVGLKQMIPSAEDIANWPVIMATAMLAMLPPVLVVVFMQSLFIKGLVESEK
jgi:sn-glycerol 3-phosphate transport system permease protein